MGKKIKAEMDAQRARFVKGAVERGVAKAKADEIFDLLAKFADYGFNKSHAAAYALIAYWTAWFKANHPAEFLAASMTLDKSNTDKLSEFRTDAQRLGIKVAPPSVNESEVDFDVRYDAEGADAGLCAERDQGRRRGAGARARRGARQATRSPRSRRWRDRIDPRLVNKKALECLANAGAFDDIEPDRAVAFASIEPMLALAQSQAQEERGRARADCSATTEAAPLEVRAQPWTAAERLSREFDAIGFFLSGHPLEAYDGAMKRLEREALGGIPRTVRGGATDGKLAASVLDRFERRTKTGNKLGIIQLSDPSGQYEAIIFQEGLALYRDLLEKGATCC